MKVLVALSFLVVAVSAGISPMRIPRIERKPLNELQNRITNGSVAEVGQFPYQVALISIVGDLGYWCGGTLVSDRWVVTVARCTFNAESIIVYLGAQTLSNEEEQRTVTVSMSGIITHENYDSATLANNIALIKLPIVVEFNDRIQPAALPKKIHSCTTYLGAKVVASGWGYDSNNSTTVSELLNYIDTTVISESSCNMYYEGLVKPSMICTTGKNGRSICNGDTGGPLVYKEDGENVLIGAASFFYYWNCEEGLPNVFTRISSFLDWIDKKTRLVN